MPEITPNGPGIPPEHHSGIFGRFYRIEKNCSAEQGGTGLGLAITRRAVELKAAKLNLIAKRVKEVHSGLSCLFGKEVIQNNRVVQI